MLISFKCEIEIWHVSWLLSPLEKIVSSSTCGNCMRYFSLCCSTQPNDERDQCPWGGRNEFCPSPLNWCSWTTLPNCSGDEDEKWKRKKKIVEEETLEESRVPRDRLPAISQMQMSIFLYSTPLSACKQERS